MCLLIGEMSVLQDHGIRCDQCDYVAGKLSHLKAHKANKHEGVRYPCTKCKYSAVTRSDLRRHTKYVHEGFRFRCNEPGCNYECSRLRFVFVLSIKIR